MGILKFWMEHGPSSTIWQDNSITSRIPQGRIYEVRKKEELNLNDSSKDKFNYYWCKKPACFKKVYQNLGWKEDKNSNDNYAMFLTVGTVLSLYPIEELEKDAEIEIPRNNDFKPITIAINVDKREQVDETLKELENLGARIIKPASDAFWGGRGGYFADPEYNLWGVAWAPNAIFDERGAMIFE